MSRAQHRVFGAALGVLFAAVNAAAQAPVDPGEPLPPGHPPVGTSADDAEGTELPPGHPAVGASGTPGSDAAEAPPGHPAMPSHEPPRDRVDVAPDVPLGSVEISVRDENDGAIRGIPVRLGILHNDVARGDTHDERSTSTDERGVAIFRDLPRESSYSYQALVARDGAQYSSESFHFDDAAGRRVLLHVFPTTSDIRQALVGMRAVVFVEPREDVFQLEANFQILNIGTTTWLPASVRLDLPEGAKAFRAGEAKNDQRIELTGPNTAELRGTFGPGQHELGFQFQVENHHDRTRSFRLGLPPHIAELRVVAEGPRAMHLSVEGFPDAEPMQGQDGSRLLVTGKRLMRGDAALDAVSFTLDDIPVPSPGRWYAVVLAAVVAVGGLASALRRPAPSGKKTTGAAAAASKEAQELILDELVALERLRSADRIGPKTYRETRAELIDALARLETQRAATA